MESRGRRFELDRPATYRLEVQGVLAEDWSEWFDGLQIEVARDRGLAPVTTLTGTVADQAALHGILRKLYTLGLPILSLSLVSGRGVGTEGVK